MSTTAVVSALAVVAVAVRSLAVCVEVGVQRVNSIVVTDVVLWPWRLRPARCRSSVKYRHLRCCGLLGIFAPLGDDISLVA
jgi:hypothetical protein